MKRLPPLRAGWLWVAVALMLALAPGQAYAESGDVPWPQRWVVPVALTVLAVLLVALAAWLWLIRRRLQARIKQLHRLLDDRQVIFDISPEVLTLKDVNGVYIDCNPHALSVFHRTREQLIGHTDAELFPADLIASTAAVDAQVVATGQSCTYLVSGRHPDGVDRTLEVAKVPVKDADGTVVAVFSVARDITARVHVEEQLRLWANAFQDVAIGVAIFGPDQTIVAANPYFAAERGYAPEDMVGMSADALFPPDRVAENQGLRPDIDTQNYTIIETEHVTRTGQRFPVRLEHTVLHDAAGHVSQVVVFAHNLTEERKAAEELRLAAVAFESQSATVVMDVERRIRRVNESFLALTGHAPEEVVGRPESVLHAASLGEDFYRDLWFQVVSDGYWRGELWIAAKAGPPKVVRATVSAVHDAQDVVSHYVMSMVDLTRELAANANLDRMSFFDRLTDLPNQNFLLSRLRHLLEKSSASWALLLIDLDRFKHVNDLRGHTIGDRLLRDVGPRLQGVLGEHDVLGRFSGGTFALLTRLDGADTGAPEAYVAALGQRVLRALHEPFQFADQDPITVTASVGCMSLDGAESADAVLRDVELAMYEAKHAGRDRVVAFTPAMREHMVRTETLATELRDAIRDDALQLYLQPQLDRDGAVTGAEMLLRWTRRCGEKVSPAVFIPIAEESGMIGPIGEWVLRGACAQLAQWARDERKRTLSLAINVSVKQFVHRDFVAGVGRILAQTAIDPALLKLEITESVVLGDLEEATRKLYRLHDLGTKVSLDDFGTGYSSLAYLSHLPLDQLKIDQSFVRRLEEDAADAMVAQTIIGIGHGLDMEVIAEGVETRAEHDFLLAHDCDAFQGFLFGHPMPLAAFEAWLEGWPGR